MKNLKARTQQCTHLFEFAVIVSLKLDADSNLYNPIAVFQCPEQVIFYNHIVYVAQVLVH